MTVLVADVGGTRIKWGLSSDGDGFVARGVLPTPRAPTEVIDALAVLAQEHSATRLELALPGLVDGAGGVWTYSANLGARDVPVRARLAGAGVALGALVNDVSAAAVGEAGGGTLALLQLGSGVGARLVVDGLAVQGANLMAGEVGHLVVHPHGPPCGCGRRGCVEAIAGWRAIEPRLSRAGADPRPEALVDAAATEPVRELAAEVFAALGSAAAALVAAADPGEIRLGGGLAAAWGSEGARRIATAMQPLVLREVAEGTVVTTSRLGDEAALQGLLAIARRR